MNSHKSWSVHTKQNRAVLERVSAEDKRRKEETEKRNKDLAKEKEKGEIIFLFFFFASIFN
jgi:hypothetical protein